jgi:hypothetical protein
VAVPHQPNGHPVQKSHISNASFTPPNRVTSLPRSHPDAMIVRSANPSIYALIKASLAPYLTTPNLSTLFLLFVVFPLISLILRARHRRRKALTGGGSVGSSNAEVVRRRLQSGVEGGLLRHAWSEVARVVSDTVKMAGSGLV